MIHCLGPVYGCDEPSDALLASCYREALSLAEQHGIDSIALAAISTGSFGYPMKDAARIAADTLVSHTPRLAHVRRIRFVLVQPRDLAIHAQAFEEAIAGAEAQATERSGPT